VRITPGDQQRGPLPLQKNNLEGEDYTWPDIHPKFTPFSIESNPNLLYGIQFPGTLSMPRIENIVSHVHDIQVDADDNIIVSGKNIQADHRVSGRPEKTNGGFLMKLHSVREAGLKTYTSDIATFFNHSSNEGEWQASDFNSSFSYDWYNMTGYNVSDIFGMTSSIFDMYNDSDFSNCSNVEDVLDVILSQPITLRYGINVVNDGRLPLENINIPLNFVSYNGEYVFENVSDVHATSMYIDSQLNFTETVWSDYNEFDAQFIEIMYNILTAYPDVFSNFSLIPSLCNDKNTNSYYWRTQVEQFHLNYDFDISAFFDNMPESIFWNSFEEIDCNLIMKMYGGGFQEFDPANFNIHLDTLDVGKIARINFFVTLNNDIICEIIDDIYNNNLQIDQEAFSFNNIGMNLPSTPLLTYYDTPQGNKSIGLKLFSYDVTAESDKGSLSVSDYGDVIVVENASGLDILDSMMLPLTEPVILELPGGGDYKGVIMNPDISWEPYWSEYTNLGLSQMWSKKNIEVGEQPIRTLEDIAIDDKGYASDIIVNYNGADARPGTDMNGGIATFSGGDGGIRSHKAENRRPVAIIDQTVDEEEDYNIFHQVDGYVTVDAEGMSMLTLSANESYDPDGEIVEYRWYKGYLGLPNFNINSFFGRDQELFATGKVVTFDPFLNNPHGLPQYYRLEVVDNSGELDELGNSIRCGHHRFEGRVSSDKSLVKPRLNIAAGAQEKPNLPPSYNVFMTLREPRGTDSSSSSSFIEKFKFLEPTTDLYKAGVSEPIEFVGSLYSNCLPSNREWSLHNWQVNVDADDLDDVLEAVWVFQRRGKEMKFTSDEITVHNGTISSSNGLVKVISNFTKTSPEFNNDDKFEDKFSYITSCEIDFLEKGLYYVALKFKFKDDVTMEEIPEFKAIFNLVNAGILDVGTVSVIGPGSNPPVADAGSQKKHTENELFNINAGSILPPKSYRTVLGNHLLFDDIDLSCSESPYAFLNTKSFDPDNFLSSPFIWDWGDGSTSFYNTDGVDYQVLENDIFSEKGIVPPQEGSLWAPLRLVGPNHEYKKEGNYVANLTVFDNEGLSDSSQANVIVDGWTGGGLSSQPGEHGYTGHHLEMAPDGESIYIITNQKIAELDKDYNVKDVALDQLFTDFVMNDRPVEMGCPFGGESGEGHDAFNLAIHQDGPFKNVYAVGYRKYPGEHTIVPGFFEGGVYVAKYHYYDVDSNIQMRRNGDYENMSLGSVYTNNPFIKLDSDFVDLGGVQGDQLVSGSFKIWNGGNSTLDYTLNESCSWLELDTLSGSSMGECDIVGFVVDTSGLQMGRHSCDIVVDSDYGSKVVTVSVDVLIPWLKFSPRAHLFDDVTAGSEVSTSFVIWNWLTGTLEYSIFEDCDWLEIDTVNGSSSGEFDTVNVFVDTSGLSVGMHSCDIVISSNGVNGDSVFSVTVQVVDGGINPVLSVTPQDYDFGVLAEGELASTSFEISNTGSDVLDYTISEGCSWLDVSPLSGSCTDESDIINIEVDTVGLSSGDYSCDVQIDSNGGSAVFTVIVEVVDNSTNPVLSVDSTGL
jgi:hypothetical protein